MQGKLKLGGGGGQVVFVFKLPAGQVEFSGLFLTLGSSVWWPPLLKDYV